MFLFQEPGEHPLAQNLLTREMMRPRCVVSWLSYDLKFILTIKQKALQAEKERVEKEKAERAIAKAAAKEKEARRRAAEAEKREEEARRLAAEAKMAEAQAPSSSSSGSSGAKEVPDCLFFFP
jgi:hypothetical protein